MEKTESLNNNTSNIEVQENAVNDNSPTLFIRHGETNYNKAARHLDNFPHKPDPIKWDLSYLDGDLSDIGKVQSLELGKKLAPIEIYKVYSSPLLRCIQTAAIALKNNSFKKITILPALTELIHTIHDGSIDFETKKEILKRDHSDVEINWDSCSGLDKNFNFSYLDCGSKQQNFEGIIEDCFTNLNKRPESIYSAYHRTIQTKNFILEEQKKLNGNQKILVFTHSGLMRMFSLKRGMDINKELLDYPTSAYYPKNCEIVNINVEL